MILSSSSNTLVRNFGYFGAIDIMKEADYDAIDLSLFTMTEDDNEFCTDGYRARIAEIRAYAEQKGIFFNQSHTPFRFNWANPNEVEERLIPRTIRALEVSALAGCKIAVVHPVHHEEYLGHEEERFEENMKYYRGLLPYAKEYGIKTVVSMNPIMIDGTGMCGGCRLTVGGKMKFACVDGPDFDGHEVDFDEAIRRNSVYKEFEQEKACRLLNLK